ncbi:thiol-disulfide oxidoreductase LTO1 [Elaeis guineensis]|uniref:Thiol-disulfide oxidoreductase LTO1 n=1 Tax=Elaeis guineensis var. tenera TaxID=51953 RepID=A0A8N4EX68_ELAGV|nr:thiol-disulfide oxidoreductase LTO1 [Elaeis guineensis]
MSIQVDTEPSSKASLWGISTSIWRAGVETLGFFESGYLTYLKLTNAKAFCPVGGGSCSDYSFVFDIWTQGCTILDYVVFFPDGAGKATKMAKECTVISIEGFPTWIIKDKGSSGEQELPALAEASGFILGHFHPS